MRGRIATSIGVLLVVSCSDQGPVDDQGGLVGVWRVVLDSTRAPPYASDSHCAIFGADRSLVYEIRNFQPEGRPADSLGHLQRFVGSFRRRADSLEWSTTRWIRYSWLQHRTLPLVGDTAVSGTIVTPLVVGDSELTIQGQPSPFRRRSRDSGRGDLCGPLP